MIPSWPYARLVCLLLLTLTVGVNSLRAQTSNKGTDFWVAYAGHRDGIGTNLTLFITSEFNATVNITAGNTPLAPVNIIANQSRAVTIDPAVYNVYIGSSDVVESNKGIHVTSDKPIAVYSHISYNARSAASLVFPTSALGKDYYAISYTQQTNFFSEFTIIGVEDGTQVEIRPTQQDVSGVHPANQTFTKTLNKGDIYQFQSRTDLSGSYINSKDCKPIAVFSGSTFTSFCEQGNSRTAGSGDNLYQQLLPMSTWGKNFITAPFYNTENGNTDVFRIQVAEDNTTITVNGSANSANGVPLTNPYSKGSIITFNGKTANVIKSDKPISVTQFQTTQSCNTANVGTNIPFPGDPEMTVLNPIEQTLKDITVYSAISTTQAPTNITNHYLNVIIKTVDASSLKVDGNSFPSGQFRAIDSEYSYIIVDVTQSSKVNPSHRITADGGFVAIAYGYGAVESYAYLAGSDLKNLSKYIEVETAGGQQAGRICRGDSYKLNLILPYITSKITWDFGNGIPAMEVSNPSYTSQIINGDVVYKYELALDQFVPGLAIGANRFKATVLNPNPVICTQSEIIPFEIEVVAPPVAQFTATNVCIGGEVLFNNTSDLRGFAVRSWLWDFGDGSSVSTEANPRHLYAAPGEYPVTLTVLTESGCTAVTSLPVNVKVYRKPLADFSAVNACSGKPVPISDLSTSADGNIIRWIWDFGDGKKDTLSTAAPFTHAYHSAGKYLISLKVITDKACEAQVSREVEIYPVPVVDFSVPSVCVSDIVEFENLSSISDHSEASFSYQWNFGDPGSGALNTSTSRKGTHKYSSAGSYNVTLKVSSSNGCDSTVTKTFIVNASTPVAEFEVEGGANICGNTEARFVNKSRVSGFGGINKLIWYLDYENDRSRVIVDNSPVMGGIQRFQYPVHHSLTPKRYRVRLEAYSGTLCSDAVETEIFINGVPEVMIDPAPGICVTGAPFQLQTSELHGFTAMMDRFAGPGVSSGGSFDPSLAGAGTHKIFYYFQASNGCADTAEIELEVFAQPTVIFGDDLVILEGQSVELAAETTGTIVAYDWGNSPGLSSNNVARPIARPTETTVYTLTVSTDKGCEAQDNIKVTVLKDLQVPNAFTPNGDGINDRWEIPYLAGYVNCSVAVFNRHGAKVFSSKGYLEPWDGRFNGTELPAGVFYYIIDPKNGRQPITGNVTILK